jgi:NADPH:quinone reductase-like Zn-dependent oxidoreductase
MVTLGLLPRLSFERSALGRQVGMEASGVIRRVGSEVTERAVGDAVLFMKGGCIANRVVTQEQLTFPKPAALSMPQAAGVLSVYVTAYYALIHLSRLRAGQRILIHSAMGGVGQAALELARHVGAIVYATAGTDAKRQKLLELGAKGDVQSRAAYCARSSALKRSRERRVLSTLSPWSWTTAAWPARRRRRAGAGATSEDA